MIKRVERWLNGVFAVWAPWMGITGRGRIKNRELMIHIPLITVWVIVAITGLACLISAGIAVVR